MSVKTRFDNWKNRLLNLTKRNQLLNFKESSFSSIRLLCDDVSKLEDKLAEGVGFRLLSKEAYLSKIIKKTEKSVKVVGESDDSVFVDQDWEDVEIKSDELIGLLKKDTIILDSSKSDVNKRLRTIYLRDNLHKQEVGSSILFLALGLLNYNDKNTMYKAPLVVIPVNLSRKNIRSGFHLTATGEKSEFNLSLLQDLKKNYKMNIAELATGELPVDQSGLDINKIFNIVKISICEENNWTVDTDFASLALFPFQKISMVKDIEQYEEHFKSHPLLRPLSNPIEKIDTTPYGVFEIATKTLDKTIHPREIFCPTSYDSSQLKAILEAEKEKSFILQGPPGTGKSQTIVNMIAQLLSKGKKILFVAQKAVALEVVKKRLNNVGLGDFCLELHSDKCNKLEIYKALIKNYEKIKNYNEIDTNWERQTAQLKQVKENLNTYFSILHNKYSNGFSAFESFSYATLNKDYPSVDINLESIDQLDKKQLEFLKTEFNELDKAMQDIDSNIYDHSLSGIQIQWTLEKEKELEQKNREILNNCKEYIVKYDKWNHLIYPEKSNDTLSCEDIKHFINVLDFLSKSKKQREEYGIVVVKDFLFSKELKEDLKQGIYDIKKLKELNHFLSSEFDDLSHLKIKLEKTLLLESLLNDFCSINANYYKNRLVLVKRFFISCKKIFIQYKVYREIKTVCNNFSWINIFDTVGAIKGIQWLRDIVLYKTRIKELTFPFDFQLWKGEVSDDKSLSDFLNWNNKLEDLLNNFSDKEYFIKSIKHLMITHSMFLDDSSLIQYSMELLKIIDSIGSLLKVAKTKGMLYSLQETGYNKSWILQLENISKNRSYNFHNLRKWLRYNKIKTRFYQNPHLQELIKLVEKQVVDKKEVSSTFFYNYHKEWKELFLKDNDDFFCAIRRF